MQLPLTNSPKLAIVDDDIYEQVKDKNWRLIKVSNGAVYVGWKTHKNGKFVTVYLHRFVSGSPKGQVDHKNGDTLDNRRENLRVTNHSGNQMNSKSRPGSSSRYKNVYWNKQLKKWKAQIRVDGQDFFLGYFDQERHAAYAVELNLPILHGEFYRSNFSDDLVAMSFDVPELNLLFEAPRIGA